MSTIIRRNHRKRRQQQIQVLLHLQHIQLQRILFASNVLKQMTFEDDSNSYRWGGRSPGSKNLKRQNHSNWIDDYIGGNAIYTPLLFRRRFGISKTLYKRLKDDLLGFNPGFWKKRRCGFGRIGHGTDVRLLSAPRILTTACTPRLFR